MSSNEKPVPNFTMKDVLKEIGEIDQDVDLGETLTTREFKKILGLGSMKSTRRRIRPLVESGVLLVTRVTRPNMAGFRSRVPAYAISPDATLDDLERALGAV